VTTEEDRQLHRLLDVLAIVENWEQLTGQPSGAWNVGAGSDLEGDDTVTYPYHVSSSAWWAITAAVNHAICLRDSLFVWQDPRIPQCGYTLTGNSHAYAEHWRTQAWQSGCLNRMTR
jgi:hypothetical protein